MSRELPNIDYSSFYQCENIDVLLLACSRWKIFVHYSMLLSCSSRIINIEIQRSFHMNLRWDFILDFMNIIFLKFLLSSIQLMVQNILMNNCNRARFYFHFAEAVYRNYYSPGIL